MGKEQNELISLLKKFKKKIQKDFSIDKLILFGSRARGTENKNSDVDRIIISKDFEGKKYFKRAQHFYFIWDSKYDVDIVCLTPEEFENKKDNEMINIASKEGIKI